MTQIRTCLAPHAIRGVENFPKTTRFAFHVGKRNRWLECGPEDLRRQDLLPGILAVVHQRDQPVRHVLDVGNDRAGRGHACRVLVVRYPVDFFGIPLLGERHAKIG